MPESIRNGTHGWPLSPPKQENESLYYYKGKAYSNAMRGLTKGGKKEYAVGCVRGALLRRKSAEIYSIARRNSNPNSRISPTVSCLRTRAAIGGVSLGTTLDDAGEGAGMVNCTI